MESMNAIKKLKKEFDENINSHVFLVETDDKDRCLQDIKELLKCTIFDDDKIKHQIDDEAFLELIIVRSEGQDIKKDQIMSLQDRLKVKPVLSQNMVYIITDLNAVNEIAANKLLKTIEEPNQNVIGFLITTNSDLILPTIKSRCEYIVNLYNDKDLTQIIDEDIHELVKNIILSIENGDYSEFYRLKSNGKFTKENASIIEKMLKSYYNTACELQKDVQLDKEVIKTIKNNSSKNAILAKTKYLNNVFNRLSQNMNFELLMDKVVFDLKDVK